MIFPTALILTLAIAISPSSAAHNSRSRRSHRDVAAKRAADALTPEEIYNAAAERAREAGPPPAIRKRGSCAATSSSASVGSSSVGSSSKVSSTASSSSSSGKASASSASSAVKVQNAVVTSQTASSTKASSSAAAATASSAYNSPWKLNSVSNGSSFFDNWTFWNYDDPTHGTVLYQSAADSWNQGLVSINSAGNAIMKVDTTAKVTTGRKSVRLHSNVIFNGGLIILDAVHMPTGCGTWPAFWSNGPNWPAGGEIDILEGVNAFSNNQVSIHTSDGCTIPSSFGAESTTSLTTGSFTNTNCASYATSNQGCGERSTSANNIGSGFNSAGGGVYAMKWDTTGISVYFFTRNAIPADITAGTPVPSTWGKPQANFPSTTCDPYKFFTDNFAIFDTTFCGDWAGNIWNDSGYAGQSQSCAAMTGYSTCADYVLNQGGKFTEAYWEVKSVKWYQPK